MIDFGGSFELVEKVESSTNYRTVEKLIWFQNGIVTVGLKSRGAAGPDLGLVVI